MSQVEVSHLRAYAVVRPALDAEHVSQLRAYAVLRPSLDAAHVSHLVAYAVIRPTLKEPEPGGGAARRRVFFAM